MIKFCHISPTEYLDEFCVYNEAHLILAHLVESDDRYTNWYKNRTEFKILDNSLFETYKQGKPPFDPDKLIEMGKKVEADVIVMSDYPDQPASNTIEAAEYLAPKFKEANFGTFFVPQSKKGDLEDYIKAFEWAVTNPLIDMIGLSIIGVPHAFGDIEKDNKLQRFLARWKMMEILEERDLLYRAKVNGKKIHFLGALDGWPGEIKLVEKWKSYIFSWDSSQAVWHGLNGIEFDSSPTGLLDGKFEKEVDFDHNWALEPDKELVKSNIFVVNNLA